MFKYRIAFAVIIAVVAACGAELAPKLTDRIKHVIVLMEENRSFDHIFGWNPQTKNGLSGKEFNPLNASDPNSKKIYVGTNAPYVNLCNPNHNTMPTLYKVYGPQQYQKMKFSDPAMDGFVDYEWNFGAGKGNVNADFCNVMEGFPPSRMPVITALAEEFLMMDQFFCSVPGPTWPNRLMFLTGTTMGLTETGPWYHNIIGQLFPQKTFFNQIEEANLTFKYYYEDTPWELFVEEILKHPHETQLISEFYNDAQKGTLPNFAFINPRAGNNLTLGVGSNDMHPDHSAALGEQLYKDIYEALRASPQWNETLFILTFDEHGGFFDHVPPPQHVPFPGDPVPTYPDENISTVFEANLGVRVPTLLISPWVRKGAVVSEPPVPQKPATNSAYDLTSIMATTRKILKGLESTPALTHRDAWAATFEHAFMELESPRTDCPLKLPDAPTSPDWWIPFEAQKPLNGIQKHIAKTHAGINGEEFPQHLETQAQFGVWAYHAHQKHRKKTLAWRMSRRRAKFHDLADFNSTWFVPVVQPRTNLSSRVSNAWFLQQALQAPNNSFTDVIIYSNISDEKEGNFTLCLGVDNVTKGATVHLSECYPSIFPDRNRDPTQHWVIGKEMSFRPKKDTTLCITNSFLTKLPVGSNNRLTLEKCVSGLYTQHYSYGGPGAGAAGENYLVFGGYQTLIAVAKQEK